MSKKRASVFERVSKLLHGRDRVHKLQRHVDLTYQFALVAPLGGGAMAALQALHLPESDEDLLPSRRARCSEGMGGLAVAPAACRLA